MPLDFDGNNMTAIGISTCFQLLLVAALFEVLALANEKCHCYSCKEPNQTGNCLNTTTCESIDAGNSSITDDEEWNSTNSSFSSSSQPTSFHSCYKDCHTNLTRLSDCTPGVASDLRSEKVVGIICASVVPSAAAVLLIIGLLAYCQSKRMERRKKDPPKMLPKAQDIDASMRAAAATVPGDQTTSGHQSTTEIDSHPASGTHTSSLKQSPSLLRQVKEDWSPQGISKAGSSSRPSALATDKTTGRGAGNERRPTYTNVKTTSGDRDQCYVNVEDVVDNEDEDNCPDYVNTPGKESKEDDDDDDLDYENVDVATAQTTTTTTAPMQTNAQPVQRSKGLVLASPGKALTPDWLANISGDRAAPMDPDYIDMTVKLKLKTMSPKLNKKETTPPSAMFTSAPDVRVKGKNGRPGRPVYENQMPALPKKPKTRTAQHLSTTNL